MIYSAIKFNWPPFIAAFVSGFAGAVLFFGLVYAVPVFFTSKNGLNYKVADASAYVEGRSKEDHQLHVLMR